MEFQETGRLKARAICWRYTAKRTLMTSAKRLIKKSVPVPPFNRSYSERDGRRLILRSGVAVAGGRPSWFYTAFDRDAGDPMTNSTFDLIEQRVNKDSRILITGCGTGITAFHLLEAGFTSITGTDLLPEVIQVATALNDRYYGGRIRFCVDDGFQPSIELDCDLVTALHWVFSAWMGNYGNDPMLDPFNSEVREKALEDFLIAYRGVLAPGGLLVVELIDSIADSRLDWDHPQGLAQQVYPVRHSQEMVEKVAVQSGFTVDDHYLSYSYGHQPRMCYWLRKT